MLSQKKFPRVDQHHLINQMDKFLDHLKEPLDAAYKKGLCSGFAVMLMRAVIIDQVVQYFRRLYILSRANDNKIKKFATLLKKYRETRDEQQAELKQQLKDCKADEQKTVRAEFEKKLLAQFSNEEKKMLAYARELYVFINSLLFAQNPKVTKLKIGNREIDLRDYLEIMSVIPPNDSPAFSLPQSEEKQIQTSHHIQALQKILSFGFDYEDKEMADMLNQMVYENDFALYTIPQHAMLFYKLKGNFNLYDSNNSDGLITRNTSEKIVAGIRKEVFTSRLGKSRAKYLQANFNLYANKHITRPDIKHFIHGILKKRGKNLHLNHRGMSGEPVLYMALQSGNADIYNELLEMKANPHVIDDIKGSPAMYAALMGYTEFFRTMARLGMLMNGDPHSKNPPLTCAVASQSYEIVRIILEQRPKDEKIDLNKKLFRGDTAITLAAETNQVNVLELFRHHGGRFNEANGTGWTPATLAARENHVPVLEWLAKNKVDLFQEDANGMTPLQIAAQHNRLPVMKFLSASPEVLVTDSNMASAPIHLAAAGDHVEAMQFMLEQKADVNKRDRSGYTPAMNAAVNDAVHVLIFLSEHGVDFTDKQIQDEILRAIMTLNQFWVIQFLSDFDLNLNRINFGGEPLACEAARRGDYGIIEALRALNFNLNKTFRHGNTLVHIAAEHDQPVILSVLHAFAKVDFSRKNQKGMTGLDIAMQKGKEDVIHFYAEARPEEVNHYLLTHPTPHPDALATLKSCRKSLTNAFLKMMNETYSPDQCRQFIEDLRARKTVFADIFIQPKAPGFMKRFLGRSHGFFSTVMYLVFFRHLSQFDFLVYLDGPQYKIQRANFINTAIDTSNLLILEFFAKQGYNFLQPDSLGDNAVDTAAECDSVEAFTLFEKFQIKLNVPNSDTGDTPVLHAAKNGSLRVIKKFAEQKDYDANEQNRKNGRTALHHAAAEGFSDVAEFLIAKGVDVNKQDSIGWTAAMYAARYGEIDVLELLLQHNINLAATTNAGSTIFIIAAHYGQDEIFQCLMKAGMRLDASNYKTLSMNALEFFIADYPEQLVDLLLSLRDLSGLNEKAHKMLKQHAQHLNDALQKKLAGMTDTTKRQEILQAIDEKKNAFSLLFDKPASMLSHSLFRIQRSTRGEHAEQKYFVPKFDF